jgi:NitT/TauT family transport system permease protein
MRRPLSKLIAPLVVLIVVLALWHWSAERSLIPSYVLPAPTVVLERLLSTIPLMLSYSLVTTIEILVGFGLAVVLGVIFAWLIAHVQLFEDAFYPWIVFVQVVPKVALGPLLVVWMGVGFLPKVLISFLLAFFPVMIDTLVGLKSVSRDYVFLLRSMGATPLKRFWRFQLPHALPHIFASLKVAVTLAAVGAIVGEFIGADKGLGYALIVATGTMDTTLLFVALAWISVLSLVLYAAVGLLERVFISWHSSARHSELSATG